MFIGFRTRFKLCLMLTMLLIITSVLFFQFDCTGVMGKLDVIGGECHGKEIRYRFAANIGYTFKDG